MLIPLFKSRSFADHPQPSLPFTVESCTWSAMGGPATALLTASPPLPLFFLPFFPSFSSFLSLLRCPIELYNSETGRLAWSGLVWSITITDGAIKTVFSLDDLANRVRVLYYEPDPSKYTGGQNLWTTHADDLISQAAYGVKELQVSALDTDSAQAAHLRDSILAAQSKPPTRVSPYQLPATSHQPSLSLSCLGLFETLAWRFYDQPAGHITNVPHTLPIGQIIGSTTQVTAAQSFTTPTTGWALDTVWVSLKQVGTDADNLTVTLYSDSAGAPNAILATSTALAGSTIPLNFSWQKFTFPSPYTLAASTPYWLVFSRTGAPDDTNNYSLLVDESLNFVEGSLLYHTGAAWSVRTPDADLQFRASGLMPNDTQISLLTAGSAGGQFLTGIRWDAVTGLSSNPYRTGIHTCKAELLQLLKAGSAAGELLTEVTSDRCLVIKSKPTSANPRYTIGSDGILRLPAGMKAPPGPGIAGEWATLVTPWTNPAAGWDLLPGRVFLDRIEYRSGACRPASGSNPL